MREGTGFVNERKTIDDASLALEQNEAFQNLNLPEYQTFRGMVGTIVAFTPHNAPTEADGTKRQSNILLFSAHAYNIQTVKFISKDGSEISHPSAADIPNLDLNKTMVTLQNPHGTNTAALHEDTKGGNAQGTFDISLTAFLNNTEMVSAVKVSQ